MLHDIMTQYYAWREIYITTKQNWISPNRDFVVKKSWHRNPINQFWSLFFWLWKNTAFFVIEVGMLLFYVCTVYTVTRIQLDVDLWNFLIILAEISSSTLLQISKSQLFLPIRIIIVSMHQIWETYRNKLKTVWINWSSDLKIFANFRHFFLSVGQNNFRNKMPLIHRFHLQSYFWYNHNFNKDFHIQI